MGNCFKHNPLETKEDSGRLLHDILNPVFRHYEAGKPFIFTGNTNAHYGKFVSGIECFSRLLWGIAPLLAGQKDLVNWDDYLDGIKNGVDPEGEYYWGKVGNFDQRLVEMASFGIALAIVPHKIWDPLSAEEKNHFYQWLNQINQVELVDSNWQFFRVMVNMGFASVGRKYDKEKNSQSIKKINDLYLGNGWYSDGPNDQYDYYNSFAFHFYGLVYAKVMGEADPGQSEVWIKRARLFASDYIYWFANDGSALPFGRSLTYRFSQAAFWSAMVFAEVELPHIDCGTMKGIIMRHMRWWMAKPIFTGDGLLTIGYTYPNLNMAENYNAPGSPYWALKTFLILALPDNHQFWGTEEKSLQLEERKKIEQARMVICRDKTGTNVTALVSGQRMKSAHGQNAAKYTKFAYSTHFGFCINKGNKADGELGHDNMLYLIDEDGVYRTREQFDVFKWLDNVLYTRWSPWKDVQVESWLMAVNDWHVRVHRIDSGRVIRSIEGGFSVPTELSYSFHPKKKEEHWLQSPDGSGIQYDWGTSAIEDLLENRKGELVKTDPNLNILHSAPGIIPSLVGEEIKGVTWYGCAVLGTDRQITEQELAGTRPCIQTDGGKLVISSPAENNPVAHIQTQL